jgi:tetratricopeptide (TPR) repeat protein
MTAEEARALFERALERHRARDTAGSIELARAAIAAEPACTPALEHLATLLVTRRHAFDEGLAYLERAVQAQPDDAGLWYALGWCAEFAAHETARRGSDTGGATAYYERASDAFHRCLALGPDGKLAGDAQDLLDHVENELSR